MPGRGGGHDVDHAGLASRPDRRRMPWSSRYSVSASPGETTRPDTEPGWSAVGGRSTTSCARSGRSAPSRGPRPLVPSSSTTSTRRPTRAAAMASAAVTVVLPDAALAGHDDEPGGGEELQRIHSSLSEAQTCAD